jgi:transposase
MLSVSGQVHVFLALQPTDMRRSFDTLAATVQEVLQQDPLSGHLFVFRSKRGDRVKVLYWNTHGYALWYTRLESGSFRFPALANDDSATSLMISAADLAMLLDGVDLTSVKRTKRYRGARCTTG